MSYRSLCVASLFFAVLFVLVPSVPARGQSDTLFRPQIVHADSVDFRSIRATMHPVTQNYPEKMELIVSIRNAAGHMVAGLAPPFAHSEDHRGFWTSLVEEGAAGHTAIEEFSVEEIRSGVAERPAIVLVLDYSGSMSQDYQFMEQGARIGAFAVDSTFPIAVVKFDHTVSVAHAMGDSNYYPRSYFTGMTGFGGGTALYDAVIAGVNEAKKSTRKNRRVIVFTDGGDNSSLFNTPGSVVKAARDNGVEIHTVGFGSADDYALRYLSDATGGRSMIAHSGRDITELLVSAFFIDQVHYRVSYRPTPGKGERSVSLRLARGTDTVELAASYGEEWNTGELNAREPKVLALFDFDRSAKPRVSGGLEQLAEALKANPEARIRLVGYTDSEGSAAYNRRLSAGRAASIRRMLVALGVNRRQIRVIGRGEANPVYRPDWPDRMKALANRRVEVEFVGG